MCTYFVIARSSPLPGKRRGHAVCLFCDEAISRRDCHAFGSQ